MRRLLVIVTLIAIVSTGRTQGAGAAHQDAMAAASDHTIWLRSAASRWDHAFPVGNGRLGAMVSGSVNRERIQLNEETQWMGGPRETDNPDARQALPEVRRLLFEGKPGEAYALAERKLMGKPWRLESYQSLGDLRLNWAKYRPSGTPRSLYPVTEVVLTLNASRVFRITSSGIVKTVGRPVWDRCGSGSGHG
jgi:alpha-L-fucosidase 2